MNDKILTARKIKKTYHQAGEDLNVLRDISFSIDRGEMVALVGQSGSGKSTLLHIIGLLDKASSGSLIIDDKDVSDMNDKARTQIRRDYMGFVYQYHYLQPEFDALENVIIPQMIAGKSKSEATIEATRILTSLGLSHRLDHRPARLSGGEQQRVAIARALVNKPRLLLADEPTGNLDPNTADEVFDILTDLVRSTGIGCLIATHNLDLADRMDRVLELSNGCVGDY